MKYQTLRSVSDIFVLCRDGEFYSLPDHVRHQGPWQVNRRGDIERLKPEYRLALARDGYALRDVRARGVQAGGLGSTFLRNQP